MTAADVGFEAQSRRYCDVLIPRARVDLLTYDCTDLEAGLAVGDCVEVTLQGQRAHGFVVAFPKVAELRGIKPVVRRLEPTLIPPPLLNLAGWLADYYCCSRGEALAVMVPKGLTVRSKRAGPDDDLPGFEPVGDGRRGFTVEVAPARTGRFEFVVGFLESAAGTGGAILLLPEVQFDNWVPELRRRFGPGLAEYHSGLGPAGLKRTWRRIRAGRYRLVVGVRSAVFAPFECPGGIAVIDAHDPVFKEQRYPRYNARDIAVVRARFAGCPVLLSDPLPAVETWHSITSGQYRLRGSVPEPGRYPASHIVDMRRSRKEVFSPRLRRELEKLSDRSAAVLYVNRKGLSRCVACTECGTVLECPTCRLPMTLDAARRLTCGWCATGRPAPETCPECSGNSLDLRAAGVDLIARELARMLPDRKVVRVQSGRVKDDGEALIEPGEDRPAPIGSPAAAAPLPLLVGTRAVLGVTWPEPVGLIAVVNLDYELSLPDYHVRERAFITLAGLVTRAEAARAKLVVQTRRPQEPVLEYGLSRDVAGFMAEELRLRQEAGLPPWRRLAVVEIGDGSRGAILTHANRVARALDRHRGVDVAGPVDARRQRVRLLVRFPRKLYLGTLLDRALLYPGKVRVRVDVDPGDTL